MNTEKKIWLLALVFGSLFIYAVYNILTPDIFPMSFVRGETREITPLVIIGPYPTEREIQKLKARGVRVLVSLLNPSNPAETVLEEEEKRSASKAGLLYMNFPMNFINLEGKANSEELERALGWLNGYAGKKIYVHCYLGRHRVALFEKAFLRKAAAETESRAVEGRPAPEAQAVGRPR